MTDFGNLSYLCLDFPSSEPKARGKILAKTIESIIDMRPAIRNIFGYEDPYYVFIYPLIPYLKNILTYVNGSVEEMGHLCTISFIIEN